MKSARTAAAILCFAGALARTLRGEEPVVLPDYKVSAAVIAKMIPRSQLAEISQEASASHTFRFEEVTMEKAPYSNFPRPIRCFVRDRAGAVLQDITNDTFTVKVGLDWKDGFLSSNQPAEYSIFYFLLRPQFEGPTVSLGYCQRLLREYVDFSGNRLNDARRHYASGSFLGGNLEWYTIPDQIALLYRSPDTCRKMAQSIGLEPEGATLRISSATLDQLAAQRGATWSLANVDEIECITPWGVLAGQPKVQDHAALFEVGWVEYKRDAADPGTRDLIAVGMWLPH